MAKTLIEYTEEARCHLLASQEEMTVRANKNRREPDFGVGGFVSIIKKGLVDRQAERRAGFPDDADPLQDLAHRDNAGAASPTHWAFAFEALLSAD